MKKKGKSSAGDSHRQTAFIAGQRTRQHLLILTLVSALGITACDDNTNMSDSTELKAAFTVDNHLLTTGRIHLDLNDSEFDSFESISVSIDVTDLDTNTTIYELNNKPATEIQNLVVDFTPIDNRTPHGEHHAFNRNLAINYTLHHSDGRSDDAQEYITIDEAIAVGDVNQSAGQPLSRLASNSTRANPGTAICKTVCNAINGLVSCTLPVDLNCYSVNLHNLIETANQAIGDKVGYKAVTADTPMWLQAAGGDGGYHRRKKDTSLSRHREGGDAGLAHTVTTITDLRKNTLVNDSIFYYIANAGQHSGDNEGGGGGPSTLVTKTEIRESVELLFKDIILIAGGGGGASSDGSGARGGWAIANATSDFPVYAVGGGLSHDRGGEGGGNIVGQRGGSVGDPNNPGALWPDGGKSSSEGRSGKAGYGGNSGRKAGWRNKDIADALGDQGRGGYTKNWGSGGGGFGGGATGKTSNINNRIKQLGAGGAGSYSMQPTITDKDAPTDIESLKKFGEKLPDRSFGWFRIIFNARAIIVL